MSDTRKRFLQEQLVGWRRNSAYGALTSFARVFATVNLILVLWDVLVHPTVDFRSAFWIGLVVGLVVAGSTMLFKICPVFEK